MITSPLSVVRWDWTGIDNPQTRPTIGGDVVFCPQTQQGFMTIRGLVPNDPSVLQYQLWIFDAERDDRFPVDGGVFDVLTGDDETIVPIHAKLSVAKPVLFAVTVEPPGGVVVSERNIALVAKPE